MSFENIVGNENVKELLQKTIDSNNILHSYLFSGIDGIGKFLFAKEFAKMILCQGEQKPCNNCKSCLEFNDDNNPDFMIIENEDKTIKIEQIRYMNAKAFEKPIISNRKVYIINNSDTMTKEAQNSLLKTLEEPPEYVTIILIASNESKLLNTIKSRCLKLNFNKISDAEIKQYIENKKINNINDDMISFFDGSLGKLYKIQDNKEEYASTEKIINSMNREDLIYIMNNSEVLYKNKDIIFDLLEYINILLLNSKEIQKINCVEYVEQAKKRLNSNANYDMTIDNLLMKMYNEINK